MAGSMGLAGEETIMDDNLFPPPALGFLRVAAVSPELRVADVPFNTSRIVQALEEAAGRGCRLALFPELSLTGCSCGDLFFQPLLLDAARAALAEVAAAAARHGLAAVVGLPLAVDGRLYDCAALVCGGEVLGLVPKTHLRTTNEYYEQRWFAPAERLTVQSVALAEATVPLGTDLLFELTDAPGGRLGLEIGADLWAPSPPSGALALAGATLLLNPAADGETVGQAQHRRELVRLHSARCLAGYLRAGAGPGESTTDLVYGGHSLVAESGTVLAETERLSFATVMAVADLDLERLALERRQAVGFGARPAGPYRVLPLALPRPQASETQGRLLRPLSATPFVPADPQERARRCQEALAIQSTGLARRLRHVGTERVCLGVSGGLDSTLALLATVRAFDLLGLDRRGIVAVIMPGFGTSPRTLRNAERLSELLGASVRLIPIDDAVRQHFRDIGHDEAVHDVVYENAQARERTQILMDLANQIGGLAIGTGDLSELALGWCTYNGDQMSMYHVNAGVPKTLLGHMVRWYADSQSSEATAAVLRDICATPITPELLPLTVEGALQETEAVLGPYPLHDFFLYHTVRYPCRPRKLFFLARQAFAERYTPAEILRWLRVFYRRFIAQQFKRSAMPDAPKAVSVALSPRADWRMPSDASGALWLAEVAAMQAEQEAGQ